jgi:class 3 adenylate cyclase/tetratricopeptide (TPR) repeat protein
VIACPSCGFEASDDFTFCPKCATALTVPLAMPEERKVVTTLFCDLVGFTAMSEAADPEDVDAVLGRYHAVARKVIEAHGGTVEKFIGDAVVGVFGVPAVHEDDPERAVRAGLRLIEAIEGMKRPDGTSLQARVGVNTGEALARLDVDPRSGRGFLTGDAVNVAARLQAVAPPMCVIVGALTHALCQGAFAFDALPSLPLKGKRDHVEAWLAVEVLTEVVPNGADLGRARIVGRKSELESCDAAIARLGEGAGGLLLVTGEAGIGKTCLVQELQARARQKGFAVLQGHTLSFGRSISYWPFLEILQQDAGIESDDSEQERLAKLGSRVISLFGDEAPEVLPYLASMLSLPVPEELGGRVGHVEGEAVGRQVYRASRLYFARLAEGRPLLVVFEDVHWLDASSAALLEHLLPLIAEVPLLVCCAARPEGDSAITALRELVRGEYAQYSSEMRLDPLSAADSTTLASQLLNSAELPVALRKTILEKAEGNPFFLEEIVQSLVDVGGLVPDEATGGYRATDQAGRTAIPDTLQGVIMARIDRLDDDLKQVLRLASVIGRSFLYRLLAGIAEAEQQLDASLAGLQSRDLVLERAREPELEFMFKHALVQQATYESIVKRRRRELHSRVAASIESSFANRLDDFYGLLAYHYTKAEDWEKAQEFLFKAGDQAGTIAADAEALEHYEQAMEVYARAFGDKWDPLQRAAVERKMGEALFRRGEHERARAHLHSSLATLGDPFPIRTGSVRRAIVVQFLRQLGHVLFRRWAQRSWSPERILDAEERISIYYSLAWMDNGGDQEQLLLALLLALNLSESVGSERLTLPPISALGYACGIIPLPRLSRFYLRRAGLLAERVPEPFALAVAYLCIGTREYWATGDWSSALALFSLARDKAKAIGSSRDWGSASIEMIDVMIDQGKLSESLALASELVVYAEQTGDQVVLGWAELRVGSLLGLQGSLSEAEQELRTGVERLLSAEVPADAIMGVGWLALLLLRQGRASEARNVLDDQDKPIRKNGIRGYFLRSVRVARAELCLVELEKAQETDRAKLQGDAKLACRDLLRMAKADVCAYVAAYRLRGTYEWLRGRPAKASSWWRRSLDKAEVLGASHEGALAELEIGRRLGDRVALSRAEAAFEAMGATLDLGRARDALMGSDVTLERASPMFPDRNTTHG